MEVTCGERWFKDIEVQVRLRWGVDRANSPDPTTIGDREGRRRWDCALEIDDEPLIELADHRSVKLVSVFNGTGQTSLCAKVFRDRSEFAHESAALDLVCRTQCAGWFVSAHAGAGDPIMWMAPMGQDVDELVRSLPGDEEGPEVAALHYWGGAQAVVAAVCRFCTAVATDLSLANILYVDFKAQNILCNFADGAQFRMCDYGAVHTIDAPLVDGGTYVTPPCISLLHSLGAKAHVEDHDLSVALKKAAGHWMAFHIACTGASLLGANIWAYASHLHLPFPVWVDRVNTEQGDSPLWKVYESVQVTSRLILEQLRNDCRVGCTLRRSLLECACDLFSDCMLPTTERVSANDLIRQAVSHLSNLVPDGLQRVSVAINTDDPSSMFQFDSHWGQAEQV